MHHRVVDHAVVKIKVRDYGLSGVEQDELWRRWRDGQSVSSIGRELGKPFRHLRRFMAQTGGCDPQAAALAGLQDGECAP